MKMAKWILPFFLLVGCGTEPTSQPNPELVDNYGLGYGYDERDPETGLRIRYDASSNVKYDLKDIAIQFKGVMECTGLSAGGPLIVFTENLPAGVGGKHYSTTGTIAVRQTYVLNHELIHYLLEQTGFPREDNNNHRSELFGGACEY